MQEGRGDVEGKRDVGGTAFASPSRRVSSSSPGCCVSWFPQPGVLVKSSSRVVVATHLSSPRRPASSLHLAVGSSSCRVVVVSSLSSLRVCTVSLAHLGSTSPVSVRRCPVSQRSGLGRKWDGGCSPWCQK